MSTVPENEFDLEKLFLPAWAQEAPSSSKYAKFEGEEDRPDRRGDRRGPRPPRREGGFGPRRQGDRPRGPRRSGAGPEAGAAPAMAGGPDHAGQGDRGFRRGPHRPDPRERREPPPPLPEINVSLLPEEKGVESLARQIKMTGRAYPLFDIAQMILQKPERYVVTFAVKKNAEGQPIQPLFVCALDDTLWLSEEEAIGHVLRKHFSTFYQADRTATEPPKGKYTFVAQCGMSGVVLGPPNYHDYQNQLRKLHAERFSRMPFEVYKSRVRIVRDEEVVKKWVEEQSWRTEYVCLNMPEPMRLGNMEAVEKHFRETHKDVIIKPVESQTLSGAVARNLRCPELTRLVRSIWEDQRRFPLQIATVLSQQFASHGLQFFKVNKTITHVSVARPHYLDMSLIPVSDGVRGIVDYINAYPKCTRRQVVETLAPFPSPATPATLPAPAVEGQPAPAPESAPAGPTPEQNALISDLHWLIHQGHVIEFANGTLETAKKPLVKPPKPEPKPPAHAAAAGSVQGQAAAGNARAKPEETPPAPAPGAPTEGAASGTISVTPPSAPNPEPAPVAEPGSEPAAPADLAPAQEPAVVPDNPAPANGSEAPIPSPVAALAEPQP